MPGPTIIEFARIADACYLSAETLLPLSTRIHYGQLASGFKGSHYHSVVGEAVVKVIAFAGTDSDGSKTPGPGEDRGTETADFYDADKNQNDIVANSGFTGKAAGDRMIAAAKWIGKGDEVAAFLQRGSARLSSQISDAVELTKQAQGTAKPNELIFVTGHSLGGGLAQIVAATLGLKGVAFNAPSVSQLGFTLKDPTTFVNVNISNDPVSRATRAVGNQLGEIISIKTGDNMKEAHRQVRIIAALEAGPNKKHGDRQPF